MPLNPTQTRVLIVAVLVASAVIAGVAYRLMVSAPPESDAKAKDPVVEATSSKGVYRHEVRLNADAFAGYVAFRTPAFRNQLQRKGIKLDIVDDQADYAARLQALADGTSQLAVFTIDSMLMAGGKLGSFPGTIVMVIDESKGADGIYAYEQAVRTIDDLDDDKARFVLTPDSPSEFLARVVVNQFNLPNLPVDDWYETRKGAADVLAALKAADPKAKRAFVLWEPYSTQALAVKGVHKLLSSEKVSGLVVDVLVAQRKFLTEHHDVVRDVVEAYLGSLYSYAKSTQNMADLVFDDAQTGPDKLTTAQAQDMVEGIRWATTTENYAYFGVLPPEERGGVKHLEDMITEINRVLVATRKLDHDPLAKTKASELYFDGIVKELHAAGFHPGKRATLVKDLAPALPDLAPVRSAPALAALTDMEWSNLSPVGALRITPIQFTTGSAELTEYSQQALDELADRLRSFPQLYLRVVGHAKAEGDADANNALARDRAAAAVRYLVERGVPAIRARAEHERPSSGEQKLSVSFILGQPMP